MENAQQEESNVLQHILVSAVLLIPAILVKQSAVGLAFYIASYLVSGFAVLKEAFENIKDKEFFDEGFLMALATVAAFCIGEYFEAVAVTVLFRLGEYLEDSALEKSNSSISALASLRSDSATVIRDEDEIRVPAKEVCIGETIVVRAGERVPLDGIVKQGSGSFDTSSLTGESLYSMKEQGDTVLSGSISVDGTVFLTVTAVYADSTVSRILKIVTENLEKKAKAENFISRFSRYYTPAVVILALAISFLFPLVLKQSLLPWVKRGLSCLVISCPCALVISVPLAFYCALGNAAQNGILVKGSAAFENLCQCETAVFDKTGTLTTGSFGVSEIKSVSCSAEELLALCAFAESGSTHPLALSILKEYGKPVDFSKVSSITEIAGKGVCAVIGGERVYAGNAKLMEDCGLTGVENEGCKTAVYVCRENKYLGCILFSDSIKADAQSCVAGLKEAGMKTVMLTGDRQAAARDVASKTGVDSYYASLLPEEKTEILKALKTESGAPVLFTGDGINDAPVLSSADAAIAMGALGSDAAIESADIIITDDRLSRIPYALRLSRRTLKTVKNNIAFSVSFKAIVLCLSLCGLSSMFAAIAADVGVMLLCVLNSLRLLR